MDADIVKKIHAIQRDPNLSTAEKASKRQELLSAKWQAPSSPSATSPGGAAGASNGAGPDRRQSVAEDAEPSTALDDTLKCAFCFELCVRPITAPCQHNFCLSCFSRWVAKGKCSCPTCRAGFPSKFAANPRINMALAGAIRLFKQGVRPAAARAESERIANANRPEEAFRTERAQRAGLANAASGRIMVTCAGDHFGPILAEHDPDQGRGVQVGDWWRDRLHCRQWGAHFPHVAGIAGQSGRGAQSVVLSGGYEDDKDEGEWFLYTGSGGRDLSGNKRTNKEQCKDQTFTSMNEALKVSCQQGLPVRVVRSYKEKRSSYAPKEEEGPVRYDGIYRIASCWRSKGAQGYLVCRYLFVRCDNSPAPWSSEDVGDRPMAALPQEAMKERGKAKDICDMDADPSWDWSEDGQQWSWTRDPPPSQRAGERDPNDPKAKKRKIGEAERALTKFACGICKQLPTQPVSTPCDHHFCKPCLMGKFPEPAPPAAGAEPDARAMRVRKVPKACPCCKADIGDFLRTAQENREVADVIARLLRAARDARRATGEDVPEEGDGSDDGCTVLEEATTQAATSVVPGSQPPIGEEMTQQTAAPTDAQVLAAEFPQFAADVIEVMLEDQGGDAAEVRFQLRKVQKAEERAKAAAAKAARKADKAAGAAAAASDTLAAPSAQQGPGTACGAIAGAVVPSASDPPAAVPLAELRGGVGGEAVVAVQLTAMVELAAASSESDDTDCQLVLEGPSAGRTAPKRSREKATAVGQPTRLSKRGKAA